MNIYIPLFYKNKFPKQFTEKQPNCVHATHWWISWSSIVIMQAKNHCSHIDGLQPAADGAVAGKACIGSSQPDQLPGVG